MKQQKSRPRRSLFRAPSPIEILLLAIIGVCCFLLITRDINLLVKIFYSKYSFLILMLMIAEYLIIKSNDRSKVYRGELERLREVQDENFVLVREIQRELERTLDLLKRSDERRDPSNAEAAEETRSSLQSAVDKLRQWK